MSSVVQQILNLDRQISHLQEAKPLPEREVEVLCSNLKDLLFNEQNVVRVQAPVTICGDIHGQLQDLLEIFQIAGPLPENNYVFMGDYVDRGYYSVETVSLLFA